MVYIAVGGDGSVGGHEVVEGTQVVRASGQVDGTLLDVGGDAMDAVVAGEQRQRQVGGERVDQRRAPLAVGRSRPVGVRRRHLVAEQAQPSQHCEETKKSRSPKPHSPTV